MRTVAKVLYCIPVLYCRYCSRPNNASRPNKREPLSPDGITPMLRSHARLFMFNVHVNVIVHQVPFSLARRTSSLTSAIRPSSTTKPWRVQEVRKVNPPYSESSAGTVA